MTGWELVGLILGLSIQATVLILKFVPSKDNDTVTGVSHSDLKESIKELDNKMSDRFKQIFDEMKEMKQYFNDRIIEIYKENSKKKEP